MSEKLHSYFIICTIDKFSKFTMKRDEKKKQTIICYHSIVRCEYEI